MLDLYLPTNILLPSLLLSHVFSMLYGEVTSFLAILSRLFVVYFNDPYSKANSLNASLFQGQPVLAYRSGVLTVNSDFLAQPQVSVYTIRSNPIVTNIIHTKADDPPMAAVHSPISAQDSTATYVEVVASPVAVETRSMYVVIPANAGPGSVLTAVAPNGAKLTVRIHFIIDFILLYLLMLLFLQVVCPPDARPGSQILVNY